VLFDLSVDGLDSGSSNTEHLRSRFIHTCLKGADLLTLVVTLYATTPALGAFGLAWAAGAVTALVQIVGRTFRSTVCAYSSKILSLWANEDLSIRVVLKRTPGEFSVLVL
jgi:hypothetical protein